MEDSRHLSQEIEAEKRVVFSLRAQLRDIITQLNATDKRGREVGRGIAERLHRVGKLRGERDALTGTVKHDKESRRTATDAIKCKIDEARILYGQLDEIQRKRGIQRMPGQIKKDIEKLEFGIETEGLDFDKEQKVMKRIKELKKQLVDADVLLVVLGKIRSVEKEIKDLKKGNEERHRLVQTHADESQSRHETLLALLKEVDGLRMEEVELEKQMRALAASHDDIQKKLDEKLAVLRQVEKKFYDLQVEGIKHRKEQVDQTIESKSRSVEEKLRRGEKLTTQDLLVWQAKH